MLYDSSRENPYPALACAKDGIIERSRYLSFPMPAPRLSTLTSTPPDERQIGMRIRAARRSQKLTLAALADKAGLDKGFLSRLERGEKSASVGTLHTVGAVLGIALSTLLGEANPKDEIQVVRSGSRKRVAGSPGPGQHAYEAITLGGNSSGFSVTVVEVGTHGDRSSEHHAGEELIFILEGRVKATFGTHTVVLERDDSVRFPGYLPHSLSAEGRGKARALIIIAGQA